MTNSLQSHGLDYCVAVQHPNFEVHGEADFKTNLIGRIGRENSPVVALLGCGADHRPYPRAVVVSSIMLVHQSINPTIRRGLRRRGILVVGETASSDHPRSGL